MSGSTIYGINEGCLSNADDGSNAAFYTDGTFAPSALSGKDDFNKPDKNKA
jgi:hypothetical protein